MELTVFTLMACLGAGTFFIQGIQAARYRSERLNKPLAIVSIVAALAGVAAFALHVGHPAMLFGAFSNLTSGITLFLYAAALFVVVGVVFAVMALRSEDGSVPAWCGVLAAVASVLLAFGTVCGFLTRTAGFKLSGIDVGSAALICFFVAIALALGAFLLMAVAGARDDADAMALARHLALPAVVVAAVAVVVYLVWFSADTHAAAQTTRTAFDIQAGTFLVGGAADATTAADKLALVLTGGNALTFWGGTVCCGLVLPAVAGAYALFGKAGSKVLAAVGAVALILVAVGMACFVTCLGVIG